MNYILIVTLLSVSFSWKVSAKSAVRESCRNILHNPVTIFVKDQIEGRISVKSNFGSSVEQLKCRDISRSLYRNPSLRIS